MVGGIHLKSIRVRAVDVPLRRPVIAAIGRFDHWPLVLVDLETDGGVVGHSYVAPYRAGAVPAIVRELHDVEAAIAGKAVAPFDMLEKKSVMELGGSDPLIVLGDPIEPTLDNAIWGRMKNTGQSCVAAKRIVVVGQERGKQFLDGLVARMGALRAGDPMDAGTTLGPVSSEGAMNGLLHQIAVAKTNGARVALGGRRVKRPGFYVEATILTEIGKTNPIYVQGAVRPGHLVLRRGLRSRGDRACQRDAIRPRRLRLHRRSRPRPSLRGAHRERHGFRAILARLAARLQANDETSKER
jgi:aldehyde dehydrogenase family protein/mandelate racemase/muconate lactonizing enzyme-like protein